MCDLRLFSSLIRLKIQLAALPLDLRDVREGQAQSHVAIQYKNRTWSHTKPNNWTSYTQDSRRLMQGWRLLWQRRPRLSRKSVCVFHFDHVHHIEFPFTYISHTHTHTNTHTNTHKATNARSTREQKLAELTRGNAFFRERLVHV